MFLSRLKNEITKSRKEPEDPLLMFEKVIAQYTIMNDCVYDLLKTVLIRYKDDIRYKNSPRYLDLWIMYILYLNAPHSILPILYGLLNRKIGDKQATLYELIAYFEYIYHKHQKAESTLQLGLKNQAQPTERLERVLGDFYFKKTIDFDIEYYRLIQYHNRNYQPLKNDTKKTIIDQLDWIDAELEHYNRTSVIRRSYHNEQKSLDYSSDNRFDDLKKEIESIHDSIKRKITPCIDKSKLLNEPKTTKSPSQHKIPTLTNRESNVIQLPHNAGFIQNILVSHGYDKRNDYHIYNSKYIIQGKKKELIQLGGNQYHVVSKIGQGGMAFVYLVKNINTLFYYGLKVQQPPHPWEFYILSQIRERNQNSPITLPLYEFHQYLDTSYILMGYNENGTLLDALNLYRNKKHVQSMPEPIALLFTHQLLEQIIALHNINITHNDLKLDNIMIQSRNNRKLQLPALVMIDYGYSIDLLALGEDCICKANWLPACSQSDYPLLSNKYHPVHADYWQLATMAYQLLFGVKMKYERKDNRYRIQETIKRYWHTTIWNLFFEQMLNPEPDKLEPLIKEFENASQNVPIKKIKDFIDLL